MDTSLLFRPFHINKLQLANRIVMAPMTRSMSPNNIPDNRVVEYYTKRALGGVGLIITEGGYISPTAGGQAEDDGTRIPAFYTKEALLGWEKVTKSVHLAGSKIFAQLWHVGSMRVPGLPPHTHEPSIAPSAIHHPSNQSGIIPIAMLQSDIDQVIEDFVNSAVNVKNIGFDGVELHGAHGYLLDQFFWEQTNQRSDKYGGSLAARVTIAAEIVKAIKAELGSEFPVILRISQWKIGAYNVKLANNPEELGQLLTPLVDAGVDAFHCSTRYFHTPEFTGSPLNLAGWVKKLTGIPTITVGGIGTANDFINSYVSMEGNTSFQTRENLQQLLDKLTANEFDLIAVGRALIADHEWPNKIQSGNFENIINFDKTMLNQYP